MIRVARALAAAPWLITAGVCHEVGYRIYGHDLRERA